MRLIVKQERLLCLKCYYRFSKSQSLKYIKEPSRDWLEFDEQNDDCYIPQLGDQVYYFFQGHEEFLIKYYETLDFALCTPSIWPFEDDNRLYGPVLCEIKSIEYIFPVFREKKSAKIPIFVSLSLNYLGFEFNIVYHSEGNSNFLVLKQIYEYSQDLLKHLEVNQVITYVKDFQSITAQIIEVSSIEEIWPNSNWKKLKVLNNDDEGYHFRNQTKKPNVLQGNQLAKRINIWEVKSYGRNHKKIDYELFKEIYENIGFIEFLKKYIEKNTDLTREFLDYVDLDIFHDYLRIVEFQMNLNRIKKRLQNGYYRREEVNFVLKISL